MSRSQSISPFSRSLKPVAQKKQLKSQRAVSSILTLFGGGGVTERYASGMKVILSSRSVSVVISGSGNAYLFGTCERKSGGAIAVIPNLLVWVEK